MSQYRRYFVPGGTYFFTLVTAARARLFDDPIARSILGSVLRRGIDRYPMQVMAIVLLPEHLHCIWALPCGDSDYSKRWRWIKSEFTRTWLELGGREPCSTSAGRKERRRGIWQRRFWEHTIRDEADLEHHADYIHYNPVKHQHVLNPRDWPWSSFHRWVKLGQYSLDWGRGIVVQDVPGE